jgi:hypothetical protein
VNPSWASALAAGLDAGAESPQQRETIVIDIVPEHRGGDHGHEDEIPSAAKAKRYFQDKMSFTTDPVELERWVKQGQPVCFCPASSRLRPVFSIFCGFPN